MHHLTSINLLPTYTATFFMSLLFYIISRIFSDLALLRNIRILATDLFLRCL